MQNPSKSTSISHHVRLWTCTKTASSQRLRPPQCLCFCAPVHSFKTQLLCCQGGCGLSLPCRREKQKSLSQSLFFQVCKVGQKRRTILTQKKALFAVQVPQVSLPVWLWELLVQLHLLAMCRACVEHPWEWWHQEFLWQPCGSPCHNSPCHNRPCHSRLCHRLCLAWLCRPCRSLPWSKCHLPRCRCPRTFPGSSKRLQRLQRPPHRPPTAQTSEVRLRARFFLGPKRNLRIVTS